MATVIYKDETFTCVTALKGSDYVHLLDSDGIMVAAFDGVTDFSLFTITDGEWTTPTDVHDCYIATVGDDGVIRKGGHKCCDLVKSVNGVGPDKNGNVNPAVNENLFDNPYYKINQTGVNEYGYYNGGLGNINTYIQDRIQVLESYIASIVINDNGLSILWESPEDDYTPRAYIRHHCREALVDGVEYTVSVMTQSNELFTATGTLPLTVNLTDGNYCTVYSSAHAQHGSSMVIYMVSGKTLALAGVKLEKGGVSTFCAQDANGNYQYRDVYDRALDLASCTVNHYRLTGKYLGHEFADGVGAVPTTRKVNGKALSADISLGASDVGAAASTHTHGVGDITSGMLPMERGGTGFDFLGASPCAIVRISSTGKYLSYVNTAEGAFFAKTANKLPEFGTLPIAYGGTGATTAAAAIANLGGARVVSGSYVGTGTYGSDNPTTITVNFTPKMIIAAYGSEIAHRHVVAARGMGSVGYSNSTSTSSGSTGIKWGDNSVSFINNYGSSNQLNTSGSTYYYTIVG